MNIAYDDRIDSHKNVISDGGESLPFASVFPANGATFMQIYILADYTSLGNAYVVRMP
jgi:hypothetical protein